MGGEPGGARNSLSTQLNFPSKTKQASHWNLAAEPFTPPILKRGDLFFTQPTKRRDCHTGAEGPGAAGSPYSFPEPSTPRRAQNLGAGLRPWSSLTVHRGHLANIPVKIVHQH